jgi:ABC-type transporter Mla subunit MlaD
MVKDDLTFWLTIANMLCWAICFLWMHQISAKQSSLLAELREQGQRIEELSRNEHDLIKEVHPQVGDIRAGVQEVIDAVRTTSDTVNQIADQSSKDEVAD